MTWYPPKQEAMVAEPGYKSKTCGRKQENGNDGKNVVKDLDLLRRRLARRKCADHGCARPRRMAVFFGIRRCTNLRGCFSRPRSALRARQRVGGNHASQGSCSD